MRAGAITGAIGWRGMMSDDPVVIRRAVIVLLSVLACTMVATQTNYFVIGETHLIAALAPIAAGAMLLGPLAATLIGAIAGAAELIHARLIPLDAYEAYFASPINSVLLFALMGLVVGSLYAWSSRRQWKDDRQGMLALLVICVASSTLFTFLFSVSVNAINAVMHFELPDEILSDFTNNREVTSQILADSILMAALCVLMGAFDRRREEHGSQRTLRETFQGWLFVVILVAYFVTAAFSYTAISAACRQSAEHQLQGQIDYLMAQLAERDSMLENVQRRTGMTDEGMENLHESTVGGIATGMPFGERGVCAVADNDVIVSATSASFVGQSFESVVATGLAEGFDESLYERTRSTLWYMGDDVMGYLRAAQMGYVRVSQSGSYQVMAALPASEVFRWRHWIMLATSIVFVSLFATVYFQASVLLKNVVVDKIDQTNDALSRITEGELDQKVLVSDPIEFTRLSSGINATVNSLKDAISAESARIERDLATAKAIQESALPRVFPPFPEIDAFDVYATMQPAREVGGDFYDLFLVDDHSLCVLVADVSGKGIPASLFMMAAKTVIANNIAAGMRLDAAIQTANWHLCQGNDAGMFVTVWVGLLDWESGVLSYVNAGHNPPLVFHGGAWQWLRDRGGLLLGSFDNVKYRISTLKLEQGDKLLLYTDGVNEAFSAEGEQFGEDRLEAFVSANSDLHPHALVDSIGEELSRWADGTDQSDDITMLALEYGVPPEVTGSLTVPATIDQLDEILSLIHNELAQRHCPISVQNKLDIAVEELFVNTCSYAYREIRGQGKARVDYTYNVNPSTITVSISDWGVPFDPLAQEDPEKPTSIADASIGGLGIFMTKQLVDDISYARTEGANVVTFKMSW